MPKSHHAPCDVYPQDPSANSHEGFHQFRNPETGESYGSFEVFWLDADLDQPHGWYWRAGFPGCLPDGESSGPFDTSEEAAQDAE